MTSADLTLIYRGPLDSCNYGCGYCPFAKKPETPKQKAADERALERFLGWIRGYAGPVSVFFTPWGEALHHARYREAIIELSHLPHVRKVAIQTNLAGSLDWLADAHPDKVGIWATWHPTEVSQDRFLRNVARLRELGVSHSVGVVGVRHRVAEIEALRAELPAATPMWVNAFSVDGGPVRRNYYDAETIARLAAVDPLFEVGLLRFASRGRTCAAGRTVLAIDGDGTARRCHFLPKVLGNLYADPLDEILTDKPCPRPVCDCHIGYVHLDDLRASEVYGDGLLERVPDPSWADPAGYLARARSLADLR
ncbi:STM4011 family radical SAM protein [Ammonicoccus fulvus]|uniref:STM4011 family radical SAM protein n=1 Tax=Ammonicoccus fulvus TaxID=3138240 RepID=A0ABZ3FSF1_9ACTN